MLKIRNTFYSCHVQVFILPSLVVLFVAALYHSSVFLCMRTEIHVGVDECDPAVLFSSFCILLYQLSCMIITVFILLYSSMLYKVFGVLYPQFSLFHKSVICTFCMFSLFRKSVICTFCMFLFPTEIHVGVDECDTAGNWTERRRTVVQTRERSTDAGFRCH